MLKLVTYKRREGERGREKVDTCFDSRFQYSFDVYKFVNILHIKKIKRIRGKKILELNMHRNELICVYGK